MTFDSKAIVYTYAIAEALKMVAMSMSKVESGTATGGAKGNRKISFFATLVVIFAAIGGEF